MSSSCGDANVEMTKDDTDITHDNSAKNDKKKKVFYLLIVFFSSSFHFHLFIYFVFPHVFV